MQNAHELRVLLNTPRRVVVLMHHKPDADALGSSLGLAAYLKKGKHDVKVIAPSDYPSFLEWMPGNSEVIIHHSSKATVAAKAIAEAELIFCLDFSSLSRINDLGDMVRQSNAKIVFIEQLIDHANFSD